MIAPMEAQPRLASLDASMPWDSMKARSLAVSPSIVIGEYLHVLDGGPQPQRRAHQLVELLSEPNSFWRRFRPRKISRPNTCSHCALRRFSPRG
jgi:hypothetical protein